MTEPLSISRVETGPAEERLVLEVLRSGQLAQGPMVAALEAEVAALVGVPHAVAVANGTVALIAAFQALRELGRISEGDRVLTTPFSFIATLTAPLHAGMTASFADIGADYCLDPSSVADSLSDDVRVLLPVHLYGLPADMPALEQIAAERDLVIVEDAAQALSASVGGRAAGSFGVGCFSLYATKNLTSGEGGVVTTDDDELAYCLRTLRNQGMTAPYEYELIGYNYRLTDLQAAVALGQLERFGQAQERRARNASLLAAELAGLPGLELPTEPEGRRSSWHQFTVRVTGDAPVDRERLASGLADRGIRTAVYYPRPMFDYACFARDGRVRPAPVPRARDACREVLSLPVHPGIGDADVARIGEAVRELFGG